MESTRVLYLSYDGMTDPLGQSQVLPYLIGLTKKGCQFTLVSFEKEERFDKGKELIQDLCNQANIEWNPLPYTKNPPILSTMKDVRRMINKTVKLHKEKNFDIIHCRSYIAAIVGLEMKNKFNLPFVFDMRGFWADERIDGEIWNKSNPLFNLVYKYFKKKEKQFLESADHTISLTYAAKKEIQSWELKNNPTPISVIPCCADLDLFDYHKVKSEEKDALRKELGIKKEDYVISYLGSVGTWYMLDEMLLFFKRLLKNKPHAKFFFITAEPFNLIQSKCVELSIPMESIIIRKAARKDVPLYLSLSVLNIFFILPAYSKKASSPTKQAEVMGMGMPIICNDNVGDSSEIIRETNSGISISNFTNETFDGIIEELDKIELLDKLTIREGAKKFYSLKHGIKSYYKVYNSVKNKRN